MNLEAMLPAEWRNVLRPALQTESFRRLSDFLTKEYAEQKVFPSEQDLFRAFRLTPPDAVRVLILGQDPYHDDGQANGLAFSVRDGMPLPPSLRNIFKEMNADLHVPIPDSGSLDHWAEQGILLLNTVLTVRAHAPASHQKKGWEAFTDAVIRTVSAFSRPVVFVLWGGPAQKKLPLIDLSRHTVLQSAHPSPLSAYRGFFGSRPFSAINRALEKAGSAPIVFSSTLPLQ